MAYPPTPWGPTAHAGASLPGDKWDISNPKSEQKRETPGGLAGSQILPPPPHCPLPWAKIVTAQPARPRTALKIPCPPDSDS